MHNVQPSVEVADKDFYFFYFFLYGAGYLTYDHFYHNIPL